MLELRALQQDFLKLIPCCLHADASHSFLRYAPVIHCRNTSSARYSRDASMYLASASFEHCSGICSHMLQASILTTLVARTRCLQKKLLSSVKQKPLVCNSAGRVPRGCDCRCGQRHLASRKFERIASDSNPTVAAVTPVQKSLTVTASLEHNVTHASRTVTLCLTPCSPLGCAPGRYRGTACHLPSSRCPPPRASDASSCCDPPPTNSLLRPSSVSSTCDPCPKSLTPFCVSCPSAYFCWACSWTSSSPLSCCPRYLTFGGVY